MAFPTILINSASGSDEIASGAGPTTSLHGTAAATSSNGQVITLDAGTNLDDVLTTGVHVIYLIDTTTGARNFASIIDKNTGTPSVTVAADQAFTVDLSGKSWAIGGKRASIGSATGTTWSRKLVDNNSSTADAMPGWTIGLEGGHTETIASALNLRGGGDATYGLITLKGLGDPIPEITPNVSGGSENGIYVVSRAWGVQYLRINPPSTASAGSAAIRGGDFDHIYVSQIRVYSNTSHAWSAGVAINGTSGWVERCYVEGCSSYGIFFNGDRGMVSGCFVRSCPIGICPYTTNPGTVYRNVIVDSSTAAISNTATNANSKLIIGNTIYNSTKASPYDSSAGISFYIADGINMYLAVISSNIICGFPTGLDFSGSSPMSVSSLIDHGIHISSNLFYNNTANVTSGYTAFLADSTTDVDPAFADPTTTYDFTPGAAVAGHGWPSYAFEGASQTNIAPGAIQPRGGSGFPASRVFMEM